MLFDDFKFFIHRGLVPVFPSLNVSRARLKCRALLRCNTSHRVGSEFFPNVYIAKPR